jgi:hypothetical protein
MARIGWAAVAAVAVLTAGCGGSGLAPVRGQLAYPDGKPAKELVGCTVVFESAGADGKPVGATGEVDADGRFEMTTNSSGDGAPVGTNKVSLNPRWRGQSDKPDPLPVLDKYASPDHSGLTVEVKAGGNDVTVTVELKPKKGKN